MCHDCGYGYSWIGVWKSDDMSNNSWSLVREARDDSWPHMDAYFRVHTVYNKASEKYVVWVNTASCRPGCFLVGTSTSPEGPFTYIGTSAARYPHGGDFDIFVDDDDAGYLIYTSTSQGHKMSVERLNANFTASVYDVAPAPTPAPSPTPVPAGWTLVGHGGCRDGTGAEPPFYTNEGGAGGRPAAGDQLSASECIAACAGDVDCTAIATAPSASAAQGACHAYARAQTPPSTPPPHIVPFVYNKGSGGDPNNITVVHAGEPFWTCLRKSTASSAAAAGVAGRNRSIQLTSRPSFLNDAITVDNGIGDPAPNMSSGYFGADFSEAPGLIKRKGVYYAFFGKCCCFCGHGSGAGVYTSTTSPLGPWTWRENIACLAAAKISATCGCGMNEGSCPAQYGDSATKAQQNFVFPVPSSVPGAEPTWVWTGDMWQSARSGLKSEDRQFWSPLTWVHDPASQLDLPLPIDHSLETWVLDVA